MMASAPLVAMLRLRAHIKVPAALWPLQKFGAEMAPSLHGGPAHLRLRWLDALRRSLQCTIRSAELNNSLRTAAADAPGNRGQCSEDGCSLAVVKSSRVTFDGLPVQKQDVCSTLLLIVVFADMIT